MDATVSAKILDTDEPELVQLYLDRDERAIYATETQYGQFCYKVAYRILRDVQDARECENDTYLRIWNLIPPNVPVCFRTFLGKLARRTALDRLDKKNAKKRKDPHLREILTELEDLLPDGNDPLEDAAFDELCKAIAEFLQQLPREQRLFFVQRYWYGLSAKEIGKLHGCSNDKVRMTLHRIRKKMRSALEKEGYLDEKQ